MTPPLEKPPQKIGEVSTTAREPLEVELLLTEAQRVSVEEHQAFRDSITPQPEGQEL